MSLAEVIPVVDVTHQAIPMPPVSPARPRISADSFKNLTARLKAPAATVVAAAPQIIIPTISVSPPVAPVQVLVAEPAALPQTIDFAPPPVVEPAFTVPPSLTQALETLNDESNASATAALDLAIPDSPIEVPTAEWTFDAPANVAPASLVIEPLVVEPIVAKAITVDPITVPSIAPAQVVVDVAPEPVMPAPAGQRVFPELINPLDVMAAEEAERAAKAAAEAEAAAERAARMPRPAPRDPEEEARAMAELAEAHIIENIWRQILAAPTADDKANYLREAREIMGDDFAPPPDEEHDLSRIAPADDVEISAEDFAEPKANIISASDFDVHQFENTDDESHQQRADDVPVPQPVASAPGPVPAPVSDNGQDTAELARSLLDMMAAGNSSGLPHERALAADTLLRLLPRLEFKPLVMLAQRLAMMENPPHLLVAKLIRDPRVEISGPLLEDCMQMTDQDVLMVIEENQADKLRMVARRRRLGRAISDALIKTKDPSVLLTLVRNMEAEISHDGFNALIEATSTNADLLAPLSTRPDLGAPFAFELFWHAPAQLRRFLLTRFLTDSETLTKILKITMATKDEDENGDAEPMSQHVIVEAFGRAMRGKLEPAADELAAALQINAKTAMRVLTDTQGEPMVVLLKAAGYPRSAMLGLLQSLQNAELPLIDGARDVEELQSMFETLSFNKARILLTYWDWAATKTGPYAPVH